MIAPALDLVACTQSWVLDEPILHAGIGKALSKKLASQGLNVVMVALQDKVLDDTAKELQSAFPNIKIRKVCLPVSHLMPVSHLVDHNIFHTT